AAVRASVQAGAGAREDGTGGPRRGDEHLDPARQACRQRTACSPPGGASVAAVPDALDGRVDPGWLGGIDGDQAGAVSRRQAAVGGRPMSAAVEALQNL